MARRLGKGFGKVRDFEMKKKGGHPVFTSLDKGQMIGQVNQISTKMFFKGH